MGTPLEEQAKLAARNGNAVVSELSKAGILEIKEVPMPLILPPDESKLLRGATPKVEVPDIDFAAIANEDSRTVPVAQVANGEVVEDHGQPKPQEEPEAPGAVVTTETQCPHCGWKLGMPDVEVTDKDKLDFVRALLGDRPFTKAYPLYGDRVEVGFKAMTIAHEDKLALVMLEAVQSGKLLNDRAVLTHKREQFRFLCTFDTLVSSDGSSENMAVSAELTTFDRLNEQWQVLSEMLSPGLFGAAWEKSNQFAALVSKLISHSGDDSFWKGLS